MNLTSVELHTANSSEVAVLSFRDPGRKNSYNVKALIGLDADEIVPRAYGGSGSSTFYNLSLEKREVIVRIELNPRFDQNETYSDLRTGLYKMISSSRTGLLQLQFKNKDKVVAAISGFVIKFEAPHSNKNPEVQITIKCDDPLLRALEPVEIDIEDLDSAHTIITDDISTAPHGFKFRVGFLVDLPSFKLTDPNDSSWSFGLVPVLGFNANDVLHVSSGYNDKYAYISRGANIIHVADVIVPGSVWPVLFPGDNEFSLEYPDDLVWAEVSYYPTYWGV